MRTMTAKIRCNARADSFFSESVAPASPPMSAAAANGRTTLNCTAPLIPCADNAIADRARIKAEFIAATSFGPAHPKNRINGPRNTPPPIPRKPERSPIISPEGIATARRRIRSGPLLCSCEVGMFRSIAIPAIASAAANNTRNTFWFAVISPPRNAAGMAGIRNGRNNLTFSRPARPNRINAAPVTTRFRSSAVDVIVVAGIPTRVMMARYPVPPPRPTDAYAPAVSATRGIRRRICPDANVSVISSFFVSRTVILQRGFSRSYERAGSLATFIFKPFRPLRR